MHIPTSPGWPFAATTSKRIPMMTSLDRAIRQRVRGGTSITCGYQPGCGAHLRRCLHAGLFVFDAAGNLTYRGAMDDARPRQPQPVDGAHLLSALEAARSGQSYTGGKPSMGCGIKWRGQ